MSLDEYIKNTGHDKYARRSAYISSPAKERALSGQFNDFDILLVDPPRKGLDIEVIDALLLNQSIKRLVYISCGFKAFMTNCDLILSHR